MISGTTSEIENLTGVITAQKTLSGTVSGESGLYGKISVSVRDVPYHEIPNASGGTTVYIGKEVVNNGN